MTPTKPAGHEDVPEDVLEGARAAFVELDSAVDGGDQLRVIAEAILADRSRRAKAPAQPTNPAEAIVQMIERRWRTWEGLPAPTSAMNRSYSTAAKIILQDATALYAPAQATELAPDVKGLVNELLAEVRNDGEIIAGPTDLDRRAAGMLLRLSAPPAKAKPVAWIGEKELEYLANNQWATAIIWGARRGPESDIALYVHPDPRAKAAEAAMKAVRDAQDVLAEYLPSDSGVSETECVNRLLGILDHQDLVRAMRLDPPRAAEAVPEGMETAPRDGSMLRLLVKFDHDNQDCNPLEDSAEPSWTIGFNTLNDTGEDYWHIAGWSWEQDCFCETLGEPIAWMPWPTPAAPQGPTNAKE